MPCFNGEYHLHRSVESVLAQTMGNFDLIVVDNGSTDRSLDVLDSFSDPRIRVRHQPQRGVSLARNLGLQEAHASLVAFLDCDDTWSPDFLEKMCAGLTDRPEAVLAYCGWQNLGLSGGRGEPFVPPDYETHEKYAVLLEGCRWPIHGALTRRDALLKAGGFNTQLTIAEDYLLWLECSAQGALVRVPEVLAQYHHHGGEQATQNRALAAIDTFRAKQFFLRGHPDVAGKLGESLIEQITWGKLLEAGNTLHWQGDIQNARPVFRKALLAGKGTIDDKLRMLPSLLPLSIHRALFNAKNRIVS